MGWFSSTAPQLGAAQAPRSFRPERSATSVTDLAGAFGEANPAQVTDTPRTIGLTPVKGEPIHGKPLTVANGWIDQRWQTGGMSVLYIDQANKMPDAEVQGIQKSAINHSRYAPYYHGKNAFWMFARWDPIFRFANTAMDMRWNVGHVAPLTANQPGNIPGTARMGPYAAPYRSAYVIPRFSTEPATIIPQATR